MTACDPGTIVLIPFPFVEQPRLRVRPALVVGCPPSAEAGRLAWVAMVTSRLDPAWPGDVVIGARHVECGLPVPSLVRTAKLATCDVEGTRPLGRLPDDLFAAVRAAIAAVLAP